MNRYSYIGSLIKIYYSFEFMFNRTIYSFTKVISQKKSALFMVHLSNDYMFISILNIEMTCQSSSSELHSFYWMILN